MLWRPLSRPQVFKLSKIVGALTDSVSTVALGRLGRTSRNGSASRDQNYMRQAVWEDSSVTMLSLFCNSRQIS